MSRLSPLRQIARRIRLGDRIETAISALPGATHLPCHDKHGRLIPQTPCWKRRQFLNGEAAAVDRKDGEK